MLKMLLFLILFVELQLNVGFLQYKSMLSP